MLRKRRQAKKNSSGSLPPLVGLFRSSRDNLLDSAFQNVSVLFKETRTERIFVYFWSVDQYKRMADKAYSAFTDQELLDEAKKLKPYTLLNAFLVGFLAGIILFSVYYSAYGITLLITLFLIYKFVNEPKNQKVKELKKILKERNLK